MTRPVSRLGLAALACIAAQACLLAVPARAVGPTSPSVAGAWVAGTWVAGDGRTLVRTEPCRRDETRLCGYVVGLRDGSDRSLRDGRNPIAERQARTLIGHQVLLGLRPAEGGQYKGWAYDAASGKSVFVTVSGGQSGGLVVQGDLPAAICGYQIWSRSGDGVPGQLTGATDMAGGPRSDPEWAALKAVSSRATDRRKHLASGTPAAGQ